MKDEQQLHQYRQHQQAVSFKGFGIFKHSCIKLRHYYKKAWMFTFNKSWTLNVWKYIGRESTRSCSQRSDTPAHTSPDIQWKLLSVSLDPAEGKSSVGWKGRCGFSREKRLLPPFWKLGIKTNSPGGVQTSALFCLLVRLLAWWMNAFQKEQLFQGSKQTPVWGEKERFWEGAPSHVAFRKHEQECALYRFFFTGKKKKKRKG